MLLAFWHPGGGYSTQGQIDEEIFMDCLSHVDETEDVSMASVPDDSESDSESESDPTSLEDDLASWATEHKITHVALNSLLNILWLHSLNLPKDLRTLLGTVRLNPEYRQGWWPVLPFRSAEFNCKRCYIRMLTFCTTFTRWSFRSTLMVYPSIRAQQHSSGPS